MTNRYIFDARISEHKFKGLLKMFCTDVPALSASKLTVVNRKTSQRIYELLRRRVVELAMEEAWPFTGEVEIDECYFGPRRVRGRRGRGAGGKTPVIGLLKRGGKVFTGVVKNCSKAELEPIIKGQVLSQTTVYTDGWLGYDGLLLSGYKHRRIHHHQNEFARGKNHVNGIESFWSYAKFRFIKLRGVLPEFFFLHLKESEWRWNHRRDNLYSLLLKNLRLKPL
jgi:transposase